MSGTFAAQHRQPKHNPLPRCTREHVSLGVGVVTGVVLSLINKGGIMRTILESKTGRALTKGKQAMFWFAFVPMHRSISRDELLLEYLKTTKTGTDLIPPGVGENGFVGEGMFA